MMHHDQPAPWAQGRPGRVAILLCACFMAAFLPRFLTPDLSPLHHDIACSLSSTLSVLKNGTELPFGQIWLYRPVLAVLVMAADALTPGPATPEGLFRTICLVTQACMGITAAILGLWLHLRWRYSLPVVLATVICWACLPLELIFSASGLNVFPAVMFGFAALVVTDLAACLTGRTGRLAAAALVGPLLLLAVLSRETMALLAVPCAVIHLRHRTWGLLLITAGTGLASVLAWLGLEAWLFHPGRSLWELVPTAASAHMADSLPAPRRWLGLLANIAGGLGWAGALAAMVGACQRRRSLPMAPLIAWIVVFLLLHTYYYQPAMRFRVIYSLPAVLLCLRALPAYRKPLLSVAVLALISLAGIVTSLPALRPLVTLPHAYHLRAERMAAHARPRDLLLFMGPDTAYGAWLLHGRQEVISFKSLIDPQALARIIDQEKEILSDPEALAPLLERYLVPAVKAAGAHGRNLLLVPHPGHLPIYLELRKRGLRVEVIQALPPGGSRSQYDPYAWHIGREDIISRTEEQVLRLSAR